MALHLKKNHNAGDFYCCKINFVFSGKKQMRLFISIFIEVFFSACNKF